MPLNKQTKLTIQYFSSWLRSGLFAGHVIDFKYFSWRKALIPFALWEDALSSWKNDFIVTKTNYLLMEWFYDTHVFPVHLRITAFLFLPVRRSFTLFTQLEHAALSRVNMQQNQLWPVWNLCCLKLYSCRNHIKLIHMYKLDLALNNLNGLMSHKTQRGLGKFFKRVKYFIHHKCKLGIVLN